MYVIEMLALHIPVMSGRFLDSSMHDYLKQKTIHMYQVMKGEKPQGQHVWIN
jgi:hypothetical protein